MNKCGKSLATSTPLNSNVIYTDETYKDKENARLTAEVAEARLAEIKEKKGETL